jgi:hypothetical protein
LGRIPSSSSNDDLFIGGNDSDTSTRHFKGEIESLYVSSSDARIPVPVYQENLTRFDFGTDILTRNAPLQ